MDLLALLVVAAVLPTKRAWGLVQRTVRDHLGQPQNDGPKTRRPPKVHVPEILICKTPSGGIPAISGDTPGSALCDVYTFDSSDNLVAHADGRQVTVFNTAGEVAGEVYIQAKQHGSGRFLCDVEDCSAS